MLIQNAIFLWIKHRLLIINQKRYFGILKKTKILLYRYISSNYRITSIHGNGRDLEYVIAKRDLLVLNFIHPLQI
jgi:hypothetical protein